MIKSGGPTTATPLTPSCLGTLSLRPGSLQDILKPQGWCIQWLKSPYLLCKTFAEIYLWWVWYTNQMYLSKSSQVESGPYLWGLALFRTSWNPKANAFNDWSPHFFGAKVLFKSLIYSIKCIWVNQVKWKVGPCLRGLALCRTSWNTKTDAFSDRSPPICRRQVLLKSLMYSIKCIWVNEYMSESSQVKSRPCLRGLPLCRASSNPKTDAFNDWSAPFFNAKFVLKSI